MDLNPFANSSTGLSGEDNPGADLVNQYGDEAPNRRTLTLNGVRYVVSRTGYAEKEVADYGLKNLKVDVSLFFRPKKHLELSYTFRASQQDNIYQRTNRFRFDDYRTQQHAFSFQSPNHPDFQLMYGLDYRVYTIVPDGNYFINPEESGENLQYWKTGGFLQACQSFGQDRIKINGVIRVEKNQYFEPKLNPRQNLVFSPKEDQSFRFSIQSGYRFPSIFEGFSTINSWGRKRIGGLPIMSSGIFENSYTQAYITQFQRAVQSDINTQGLSLAQAVEANEGLLAKNDYTYLEPEQVTSLEWGYRASLAKGKLYLDVDFYLNQYQNLMAQLDANVPKIQNPDSLGYSFLQNSTQDLYRLWTNSKTEGTNYGGSLGLSYTFYKSFLLSGNFTYSKLSSQTRGDGLEDGFNTPEWIYNLSISNPSVYKSLGFQMNFRQQAGFLWESALATGWVEGYSTLDAQLTAGIFKNSGSLKIGATNALNRYYYSFLGGPAIGGFYYTSVTFEF